MRLLVTFLVMLVAGTFGMPYDPSVNPGTSVHVNSLQSKNETDIMHHWENVGCDYVGEFLRLRNFFLFSPQLGLSNDVKSKLSNDH